MKAQLIEGCCVLPFLCNICTAEEDFSTAIKILEFDSGDKYIDVNISVINDESIEGNETFSIYLTSDVGVNVSPYVQTEVTIIDNDKDDDKDNEDDEDDGDGSDDDDDSDNGDDNDGGDDDDYNEGNLLGLSTWV